jgi:Transposase DDE domain
MQITDYIIESIIDLYPMWEPKFYRLARKRFTHWLSVRKGKKSQIIKVKFKFKPIKYYFPKNNGITLPKAPYLRRFRSITQAVYSDFSEGIIPKAEWDMLKTLPKFKGYFNYLFELNQLSYFDDLQEELEAKGLNFKGIFLYDIIALELFRRQLGFKDFAGLEKLSYFLNEHPLKGIVHDAYYYPSAADISYILNLLPPKKLMEFYYALVQEAIDLGIIDPRILLWDGQFVRSNCNNNFKDEDAKKAKRYNDPDAGYCRHNGVKKGVGYEASNLYAYCGSWDRILPVYFEMVAGNRNENPVFRETLGHFLTLDIGKGWRFIILDTGGYSQSSLNFCVNHHIYPLIRAKKGLKNQPTKELKKGYYFNTDYIPEGWSVSDILKTYSIRPAIEAGQSSNNTFYNSQRLNTRGKDMATISRVLNYILDLLRAITATKLGRVDLLCKLSAFSSTREHMSRDAWVKMARQSNYKVLFLPALNARQKEFWDKWERRKEQQAKK